MVAILIPPVLNPRRSAQFAYGDWETETATLATTASTASVGVRLAHCQASTPASAWYLSQRIPSAATSMLVALVTRLLGDFMLRRSTSSQGLAQVPCIPCITFQVVLNDAFLLILQVKKWEKTCTSSFNNACQVQADAKFKLMPSSK